MNSVLAVMDKCTDMIRPTISPEHAAWNRELRQARKTVEQMAGALAAVRMLRQLGGMMHGSREVVLIACDAADEALAAFNGEQS